MAVGLAVIIVVGLVLGVRGGGSAERQADNRAGETAGAQSAGGGAGGDGERSVDPPVADAGSAGDPLGSVPNAASPGAGAAGPGAQRPGAPGAGSALPGSAAGRGGRKAPGGDNGPGSAPVALRPPVTCAAKGEPTGPPLPPADERDGKRWITVSRLAGSCDASSPGFRLLGLDTRLVWRSDADSFVAFVVDTVQGTEATAGFADAQCAGPCSDAQALVPPPGDYNLRVQAGDGPWELEIQEYR